MERLYECSLSGSVNNLNALTQEDPQILNRVSHITHYNETPLHIAAMLGHEDFVGVLLVHQPNLATMLDSFGRSPLHVACAEGYVEIVRKLLDVKPQLCCVCDKDGRTPLHLAVINEQVDVIKLMIRNQPEVGKEKFENGGTILHLCVKYNRVEALKILVECLRGGRNLINAKDDNGDTILHLAVAFKQMESLKYVLSRRGIRANVMNESCCTAMDVSENCPSRDFKALKIREILVKAKVPRANDPESASPQTPIVPKSRQFILTVLEGYFKSDSNWIKESHGNLILAATVTATMAFQAGINPPGSTWDEVREIEGTTYYPGNSISASMHPHEYKSFLFFITISLLASLSTILLTISGFPLKNKFTIWLLRLTLSTTVVFIFLAYLASIIMITSNDGRKDPLEVMFDSFGIWIGLYVILVLYYSVRFMAWFMNKP